MGTPILRVNTIKINSAILAARSRFFFKVILMTFRTEYNFSVATSIIFLMNFMLLSFSQMA
jgi:hypothetical protein